MIKEFLELLRTQVNRSIYVWGGNGEIVPEREWIEKKEKNAKDRARILKLYDSLRAKGVDPIQAFDCSGLLYWGLKNVGVQNSDISSRGLYAKCKKIGRDELIPGDLVFRHNGTEVYHVGVFSKTDTVIECQGRDVGTVERNINASGKGYWNKYGRLPAFEDDDPPYSPYPPAEPITNNLKLKSPWMRDGANGVKGIKSVQEVLKKQGYNLGGGGTDGIFGPKTDSAVRAFQKANKLVVDGIVGVKTREAMGLD